MSYRKTLVFGSVLLLGFVLGACQAQEETIEDPAPLAEQVPEVFEPMVAEMQIDDVTLGSEVGEDGSIPMEAVDDDFVPGDAIYVAMEVGDAPEGTDVRVVWKGSDGATLGEETKQASAEEPYMNFQAPDTSGWQPGDYQVEIYANEQLVEQESFNLKGAEDVA